MPIWLKVMLGLFLGALAGPFLGPAITYVEPVGHAFIAAIKMLVMPLIFVSLVGGIASVGDLNKMGRIGLKTFGLYLATTLVAIPIGLVMAIILQPGAGMNLQVTEQAVNNNAQRAAPSLLDIIPTNPFQAFAEGDTLQVIVFSILLGIAIAATGDKAEPFNKVVESLAAIINKLISMIIELAPFGVFALISVVTARYGIEVLLPMAKLILALYVGCLLHALLILGGLVKFIAKLSPVQFFRGIFEAQIVAFSTTSAAGTLPVTISCTRHNLGVSKEVAGFVLPVGATVNMDGTALYQALAAVFIAQAYGIPLGPTEYLTILGTTIVASIGTASVPAAGLVVLSMVLSTAGLPLEGIALVAGIDRILDMARTAVNVTGDATVALLVASSEGALDRDIFNKKTE
jgi:Na+/H+-dicarboxylate symporter